MATERTDDWSEALRQVTAATMRAVAHEPALQLAYSPAPARLDGHVVRLPLPLKEGVLECVAVVRGEADAMSLLVRFHDERVHRQFAPREKAARQIFNTLEQARCEARGVQRMPGIARNLVAALEERCRASPLEQGVARESAPLAEVVGLLAREHFTGQPIPESAGPVVALLRPWIEAKAGDALSRLAQVVHDQRAFAVLARGLAEDLTVEQNTHAENAADEDRAGDQRQEQRRQLEEAADAAPDAMDGANVHGAGDGGVEIDASVNGDSVRTGEEAAARTRFRARPQRDRGRGVNAARYRVFTTEFDEVVEARALCSDEELAQLRLKLDTQLEPLQPVVEQLAKRLQRRVMSRQTRAWDFDLEEGVLDATRLARVVTDPLHPLAHKRERDTDFLDTVVQLLIDNSGSMRGRPIAIAAMSADIIARTLERCGVKVEILGFTTCAWKGGRSRERWLAAGKPPAPGRLNDLRHIIYKSADAPWRRTRRALGLMLRDGLLKENIDGEALLWAHARLLRRAEPRRILMVISDGGPLDDSTLSVNPGDYLEKHLRDVIDYIEERSPVQLVAIGIEHDVTRFYRRAVTLIDVEQLGGTMLEKLANLFATDGATTPLRRRV